MLDKFFKDKHGKLVIFQKPNLPLYVWAAAALAAKLVHAGTLHNVLSWLAFIAIFIWALLEITTGHSLFRRALGLVVLVASVYSRLA